MTVTPGPAEPLAGFRVLDLTTFLSGPLATRTLATLGAEVVKIEPPSGDPTRAGSGLRPGGPPSPYWLALHRDRRAMVLDLKSEAGREVLLELVEHADALVENFRPGVMARLDLGPEVLRGRNPRLVTCAISGFGGDGPMSQLAAIDGPVQAFTGLLDLTGVDGQPGLPVPMQVADIAGASYAASAVLAALLARERTGQGAHIDLSLAECLLQWLGCIDRSGSLNHPSTMVLEAADGGRLLVQPIMHFHARFAALVAAVPGFEAFAEDPRFGDRDARRAHRADYEDAVRAAFRTRPAADWLADLHASGVPAAAVHASDDVLSHPQLVHRGASIVMEGDGQVTQTVLAPPFTFDGERRVRTSAPPTLGEHTAAVLRDWLGYDDERLAALGACGALG